MPAPFHSAIDRGEHDKYLFLSLYGNTEIHSWQRAPQDRLVTVKRQKGNYALFSVLSKNFAEGFKQKDSMLNTSAITAVAKVSMKPQSVSTADRHLHGSQE